MMMLKLILSKKTEEDIDTIYEFGKIKFGKQQSIKYLEGLNSYFKLLLQNATIGKHRPEIKQNLYSSPYQSHIIFYRITKTNIRIIRVLYGGRDLIKFLK